MCGQFGHIKKKCPKGGAGSENGSDSKTNTVTFDDEILYGGNVHPHGMSANCHG